MKSNAVMLAIGVRPARGAAVPQELRHLPADLLAGVRHRHHGPEPHGRLRGPEVLGHAAFFGIGAYTRWPSCMKAGISFWIGLPPPRCAVCVGLILGFPALRVQTIYLAFATLGFNTAIWLVMRNEEWLTGGTFGINNIVRPGLFGAEPGRQPGLLLLRAGGCGGDGAAAVGLLRSPGARPSPRCATTRSAPRAWVWTSAATRC
jgi:hypothetical protein